MEDDCLDARITSLQLLLNASMTRITKECVCSGVVVLKESEGGMRRLKGSCRGREEEAAKQRYEARRSINTSTIDVM